MVVEKIYRYMEEGGTGGGVEEATGEGGGAVIAATATTLAAFAPLLLPAGEIAGSSVEIPPHTLIVTLASSLFVAWSSATLCAMFMAAVRRATGPRSPAGKVYAAGSGARSCRAGRVNCSPGTSFLATRTSLVGGPPALPGTAAGFQFRTLRYWWTR